MKSLKIYLLLFVLIITNQVFSSDFNIKTFKLDNGLTVILNEDHSQTRVYGAVVANAGSANEPEDATGLAHYLEHVMFNGTSNLGTINWEAEKVHYEKIIDLFETLRSVEDEEERASIIKEINEESKAQGKYFQTKEFVMLLESIGTTQINAGTSYDYTYYHSVFPSSQSKAWLQIYANEFINPVFRNFQAELETVYEEFNMRTENPSENFRYATYEHMFKGSPYGRTIGGKSEHLKSPSLKSLIEFYDTWYVPENMALVLVGDFNPETITNEIKETFGLWEAKPFKNEKQIERVELDKKTKVRLKVTPYTIGRWCFNAPCAKDDDIIKMQLLNEVLSNSSSIGLLDQLETDGDLMSVFSYYSPMKKASIFTIQAIPNYDVFQMRQLSTSEIDDLIFDKIEEVKEGKIDENLLNSVRDNYIRDMSVSIENFSARAGMLMEYYISDRDPAELCNYISELEKVTVDDIVEIANKYLTDNYLEISSTRGEIKLDEISKLDIDPILQTVEESSAFAKKINNDLTNAIPDVKYIDFGNDIERVEIADKVDLLYKQNKQNDIFNLVVKYHIGTATIPTLEMAVQLMNNAGIRGNYKPHELKKKMGELGCSYSFSANNNVMYVSVMGREKNLEEACRLISMITLMPDLDIKQYNSLMGMEMNSRNAQKFNFQNLSGAAFQYLIYGENSPNIDRLSWNELSEININNLTGDFIKATKYEATVHYYGGTPFIEAKTKLLNSLAFAAGRIDAPEYFTREISVPTEDMVYFVNKPGTRQSNIYVVTPVLDNYSIEKGAKVEAYSKYFGEGWVNIFFQEIRAFRSMAYTASANILTPAIGDKPAVLLGYVGTQGDKTNDAVELVFNLLNDMPLKPKQSESVKNNLVYGAASSHPTDRYLSQNIESWERMGYTEDPVKYHEKEFAEVNIDYINAFYSENIQNKPKAIIIVGDKKKIDTKAFEKLGNYKYVNSSKLFNE